MACSEVGISAEQALRYRIWKDEDKDEIVDVADSCKLFDLCRSKLTFLRVIKMLESSLGYDGSDPSRGASRGTTNL